MNVDQTEAGAADMCCASCGKSEVDDIKLKNCDDCDLVKYCSDQCQQDHLPQHEVMCIERVVELRDEKLFKQPESSFMGDCPICFLPLPLDPKKSSMQSCCSKVVCKGCLYADFLRQLEERLGRVCPFCRQPLPKGEEEAHRNNMKRAEANDPIAIRCIGAKHYSAGDYDTAFEYWTKAAELGDAVAHFGLSLLYEKGQGVEKDKKKEVYHLKKAAIAGHHLARFKLGLYERKNEGFERAVKHWIIAANLGSDEAIGVLKQCYKWGKVTKEDFATALRGHQAAVDATKSLHREAAPEMVTGREVYWE